MVLALQVVDPVGDADLGGAGRLAPVVVDLVEESPAKAPMDRAQGNGPVELEAPGADEGPTGSGVETPMIWPNLVDPKVGGRFILDDPTEAYL